MSTTVKWKYDMLMWPRVKYNPPTYELREHTQLPQIGFYTGESRNHLYRAYWDLYYLYDAIAYNTIRVTIYLF